MKGLLLVNLGTPNSPGLWDVWRYLNEFLTDARVIDLPWWRRQALVRGVIVPARFMNSSKLYREIWTEEGSPLLYHSQKMCDKLQARLGEEWRVVLAMRYQNPSIRKGLEKLRGCSEVVIFPLFPQYASATSGSVVEKVMQEMKSWQTFPSLRFIGPFYDHPLVIKAVAAQAHAFHVSDYDRVFFSFHGLPVRQLLKSHSKCRQSSDCCKIHLNCYAAQCQATASLLARELGLASHQWEIGYQSRLGKDPWLEPYAIDSLKKLRREGAKKILVFSPAFVADCLETIQEIGIEYATEFRHLGGEKLDLVPSLNDSPLWIEALERIVISQTSLSPHGGC